MPAVCLERPGLILKRHSGSAAFLGGTLAVAGFAPFHGFPLPLLSLALLFGLWLEQSPRRAARDGCLFGLGFMGFGVFWLRISIDQFGNVGTALAIAATLLFVLVVALYFGLTGWLAARSVHGVAARLLLLFPAVWVLVEWLRGWFLSGFPWLTLGYSQLDTPLAGYAPLLGVFGVSWATALSAGLLVLLVRGMGRRPWWLGLLALIWMLGALLQQVKWTQARSEPMRVSLIQPNIPQARKWAAEMRLPTLDLYARLTREQAHSDLVVWPETAVPDFLHRVDRELLRPLALERAKLGQVLFSGIPVLDRDTGRYYNAGVVLGADPEQAYYKRHLVPFGEYLPFKAWLGPLLDFLEIPMSDFAPGAAERPLVQVAGLPAGISICYEDAFGAEVVQALPQAAYLINLSNDAWFGDSLAPHQHLQMARMRTLETGRPMLRATNTGISALIGPNGGIISASPLLEAVVLRGEIQPMQGSTPFVRWGNTGVLCLLSLCIGLAILWRGRSPETKLNMSPGVERGKPVR